MRRPVYKPKKRNSNLRSRTPVIVFALEGDNKTERYYLQQLAREKKGKIRFHFADGNATDPVKMMRALIEKAVELDLHDDWYGFSLVDSDCDPRKDSLMAEADRLAEEHSPRYIRQIVSSPCFEIWFLLHYKYTTAQYGKSSDVVDRLKSEVRDYSKSKVDMYELLQATRREDPCENARKLMEHCKSRGARIHTTGFQPSTEMYIVIECIQELTGERKGNLA